MRTTLHRSGSLRTKIVAIITVALAAVLVSPAGAQAPSPPVDRCVLLDAIGDVCPNDFRVNGRVSVATSGHEGNDTSFITRQAISEDGRLVAFASRADNLVAGDLNQEMDIFVRDRLSGTTQLVSRSSAGVHGDGQSFDPSISGDGRFVAFASVSTNLDPGQDSRRWHVFVHDLASGTTVNVSRGLGGFDPSIVSHAGRFLVAFTSGTHSSVFGWRTGIYLYESATGSHVLVSRFPDGSPASFSSNHEPVLSADGGLVAFTSDAPLVADDANGYRDIFTYDVGTGDIELASRSFTGEPGDQSSDQPALSSDGRFLAFQSRASNVVPDLTPVTGGVFVRDLRSGATERVNISTSGEIGEFSHNPTISADGRFVAFTQKPFSTDPPGPLRLYVRDRALERTQLVEGAGGDLAAAGPSMSGDGSQLAFSSEGALVADDENGVLDVFVAQRTVVPCVEDGFQELPDEASVGAVSAVVHENLEPALAEAYWNAGPVLHDVNCAVVVPFEDAVDRLIGEGIR